MADEFIKGFAILSGGLLVWMTVAAWFNTPSFYEPQFIGPDPEDPSVYVSMALVVRDAALTFGIVGALTFWVFIPAGRRAREHYTA